VRDDFQRWLEIERYDSNREERDCRNVDQVVFENRHGKRIFLELFVKDSHI
jgi:hypothetical protein